MSFSHLLVAVTQCFILCLICVGFSTANQENSDLSNDQVLSRGKRDIKTASYFYFQQPEYPRDCQEVYDQCNNTTDGVYLIKPDGYPEPFEVFCINTIGGGGWTVFQRRKYGDVNFYRNWADYKNGFGFIHRDFWLGNDKLAYITYQKDYELRIDVVTSSLASRYAQYTLFRISDEGTKYKLVGLGNYSGNAGDGMNICNNGGSFSTRDQDNDGCSVHDFAEGHKGGWWYNTAACPQLCTECFRSYTYCNHFETRSSCINLGSDSNLNGDYNGGNGENIAWYYYYNCNLKFADMKIRPSSA